MIINFNCFSSIDPTFAKQITYQLLFLGYKTGRKVAEGFKESMRIVFDEHLRQWNYTAIPDATTL
jgi:N-acetyl-anhydromuramyl-L-alanine amidase AmpD